MIFSLPNGKIIKLTLEQYLELTDEDIAYLVSIDYGDYPTSPWFGSAIKKTKLSDLRQIEFDEEQEDPNNITFYDGYELDDIPDLPDDV